VQDLTQDELVGKFVDYFELSENRDDLEYCLDFSEGQSIEREYVELVDHFGVEFANYFVENPSEVVNAAEVAMKEVLGVDDDIRFRVIHVPDSRTNMVRELRTEHLNEFISVRGLARRVTEVRPKIVRPMYRCSECGGLTEAQTTEEGFGEPLECSSPNCEATSNTAYFVLSESESEFRDYQQVEIQENPDKLEGGEQPQKLACWLREDIVDKVSPGDNVTFNGILKPLPKNERSRNRVFDIYMDVNSVEMEEKEFEDIELTDEDVSRIKELSEDEDVFKRLVDSFSPSIYGLKTEKAGMILQMFGGVPKTLEDGTRIRGDIHILLVGDPGTAKSQLLLYASELAPRGMFDTGKGASGVGLTAAAVKEKVFGESRWVLEAGTLVLADKGMACVDELDKMRSNDRDVLHEVMEQQQVSIAKAGMNATLNARCSILSAANPEHGRFEVHEDIAEQIDLPPPLVSRFDLIFPLIDEPEKEKDSKMANHMLEMHKKGQKIERGDVSGIGHDGGSKERIEKDLFKKYVAYGRTITPVVTEEVMEKLKEFYVKIRNSENTGDGTPVTSRQLESMIRLAEASAKAHLREEVNLDDVRRAKEVTEHFFDNVDAIKSGEVDIGLVPGDDDQNLEYDAKKIIREKGESRRIGESELVEALAEKGYDPGKVENELRELVNRKKTDIYRPTIGEYALV